MAQVFVGNLPYTITESQLSSAFGRFGRVSSVRIALDRSTGRPRGFAFVTMSSFEDSDEAIVRLNGSQMSGRTIVVNAANRDDGKKSSVPHIRPVSLLDLL